MIKVKVLENYKGYKKDNLYTVNENEAHALIDNGYAEIYKVKPQKYQNKMMKTK